MNKLSKILIGIIVILIVVIAVLGYNLYLTKGKAKTDVEEFQKQIGLLEDKINQYEEEENRIIKTPLTTISYEEYMRLYGDNEDEGNSNNSENELSNIEADKIRIVIDEDTVTPTSMTMTIINDNSRDILYGEPYNIQRNVDGNWEKVEPLEDSIWTTISCVTRGNCEATRKMNLATYVGELESGIYRVEKEINGFIIYSNEFEIK